MVEHPDISQPVQELKSSKRVYGCRLLIGGGSGRGQPERAAAEPGMGRHGDGDGVRESTLATGEVGTTWENVDWQYTARGRTGLGEWSRRAAEAAAGGQVADDGDHDLSF
jgi:hypothetical protein